MTNCVAPAFQRQGVDMLLLARACEQADDERKECLMIASSEASGLCKKLGFQVVEK